MELHTLLLTSKILHKNSQFQNPNTSNRVPSEANFLLIVDNFIFKKCFCFFSFYSLNKGFLSWYPSFKF